MEVWIVFGLTQEHIIQNYWETMYHFEGVFSSKENAENFVKERNEWISEFYDTFEIEKYKLDEF